MWPGNLGSAALLHTAANHILAGALDGAAADWEPHRAVSVIVNPPLVIIEVVDLPLDEIPILCVLARVADLAQPLEELLTLPIKEHVFPTFEMLPVPRGLFPIQVLADIRDMFACMIEVQNTGAVLGGDLNEAIPDPPRPIGQEHHLHPLQILGSAQHFHRQAFEEQISTLDSADIAAGAAECLLPFLIPTNRGDCPDLRIAPNAGISLFHQPLALPALSREASSIARAGWSCGSRQTCTCAPPC